MLITFHLDLLYPQRVKSTRFRVGLNYFSNCRILFETMFETQNIIWKRVSFSEHSYRSHSQQLKSKYLAGYVLRYEFQSKCLKLLKLSVKQCQPKAFSLTCPKSLRNPLYFQNNEQRNRPIDRPYCRGVDESFRQ